MKRMRGIDADLAVELQTSSYAMAPRTRTIVPEDHPWMCDKSNILFVQLTHLSYSDHDETL